MKLYRHSYQQWLTTNGIEPDAIERAVRVFHSYLTFCAATGHEFGDRESFAAFLDAAVGRGVRPHNLLNYWKDLRLMGRWAVNEELLDSNPLNRIPRPLPSLYEKDWGQTYRMRRKPE